MRTSGLKVRLPEQPFQILAMLPERPGRVVTREELQQRLWGTDTFMDFEHSLNTAVKKLREALGDDADNPHFVETLHQRGYRFIAPVDVGADQRVRPPGGAHIGAALQPADLGAVREPPLHRWRIAGLRASALLAVVMLLVGLNVAGLGGRLLTVVGAGRAVPQIQYITVLPLKNLSGGPEQEYFADGMTDALITELGKVSALRVISIQSMLRYKGTEKSVPEIAQELNVDALIEGSVLHSEERLRINAQLVQADPEKHLWARSFERDLRDILALQSGIAQTIAEQIRISLTSEERTRVARVRKVSPEAHEAYLKGPISWSAGPSGSLRPCGTSKRRFKRTPTTLKPMLG